jgi:hypothetical protein
MVADSYTAKAKALWKIASKIRDAFTYDPGHSDLDDEQPIHITVTLGDWRRMNWALNVLDAANQDEITVPRELLKDARDCLEDECLTQAMRMPQKTYVTRSAEVLNELDALLGDRSTATSRSGSEDVHGS